MHCSRGEVKLSTLMTTTDIAQLVMTDDSMRQAFDISKEALQILELVGDKNVLWSSLDKDEIEELDDTDKASRELCISINQRLFEDERDDLAKLIHDLSAPPPPPPTVALPRKGVM